MKLIPLSEKGKNRGKYFAKIDDDDYEIICKHTWYADFSNYNIYAGTNIRQPNGKFKKVKMHRLIMNTPKGMDTDHINRDGLDNQKSNLRNCTRSQNAINSNLQKNSSTNFIGVSVHKAVGRDRYVARASINNKRVYVGLFDTKEEAARAYNLKAIELHGEFANLNRI